MFDTYLFKFKLMIFLEYEAYMYLGFSIVALLI